MGSVTLVIRGIERGYRGGRLGSMRIRRWMGGGFLLCVLGSCLDWRGGVLL